MYSTYGWRAKMGVLIPSGNSTAEAELNVLRAPDVTFHFARVPLRADTKEELEVMAAAVPQESQKLADAGVDVIAFGCTAGSFYFGHSYDERLAKSITAETSLPATTTSSAVLAALRQLGVVKLSVLTPYPDWLNERLRRFFCDNRFELLHVEGLGLETDMEKVPPGQIYDLARDCLAPGSEGLFISCTDFPSLGVVEALEQDLGLPVVTSNAATVWMMYQLAGIQADLRSYGKLWQEQFQ
jgi:maleate isomerase